MYFFTVPFIDLVQTFSSDKTLLECIEPDEYELISYIIHNNFKISYQINSIDKKLDDYTIHLYISND